MSEDNKTRKRGPQAPIDTEQFLQPNINHQQQKQKLSQNISTPITPFDVIHDDLEMYRAIVEAFKLLSSKNKEEKDDREERKKDAAQKHMKRLSLVAIGFDDDLASTALLETNYDIAAAVEYCQLKSPAVDSEADDIEFE